MKKLITKVKEKGLPYLQQGQAVDANDFFSQIEEMSFEEMLSSLDIYDKTYKFPCEEYEIIGDTSEIDKIIKTPGIINIDIGDITNTLSKDNVNYISVGYGEGAEAISEAIKEALDNLHPGIDGITTLLIQIWIPSGGVGSLLHKVAYITNFIKTLPDNLDVIWGIAQSELPYCGELKKQKVKASLIAASK